MILQNIFRFSKKSSLKLGRRLPTNKTYQPPPLIQMFIGKDILDGFEFAFKNVIEAIEEKDNDFLKKTLHNQTSQQIIKETSRKDLKLINREAHTDIFVSNLNLFFGVQKYWKGGSKATFDLKLSPFFKVQIHDLMRLNKRLLLVQTQIQSTRRLIEAKELQTADLHFRESHQVLFSGFDQSDISNMAIDKNMIFKKEEMAKAIKNMYKNMDWTIKSIDYDM